MKNPKFTIVTPSLNQSQTLERTINSVLSQKYNNFEYFLIDGGSTDNSINIIQQYANELSYWVSEIDRGQSHAINKGWKKSTGDILSWINSDDYYLPETLSIVAKVFEDYPEVKIVIGECELVDEDGKSTGKSIEPVHLDFYEILQGGEIPGQPSVFISKEVLEEIGCLNEDFYYIMDWEFWIRIAEKFPSSQMKLIYQPLSAFNMWESGKTQKGLGQDLVERERYLNAHFTKSQYDFDAEFKNNAFGSIYWKQARRNLEKQQFAAAIKFYLKSLAKNPIKFNPVRFVYQNIDTILPKPIRGAFRN